MTRSLLFTLAASILCASGSARAQPGTFLTAGFGMTRYDSKTLDLFVRTLNEGDPSLVTGPLGSFSGGWGWHAELGYTYTFDGIVSLAFSVGWHDFGEDSRVDYSDGSGGSLGISARDLTLTVASERNLEGVFLGPVAALARRRVTLDSQLSQGPLADDGLNGEYAASTYELRFGATAGIRLGRRLTVTGRLMLPGRRIGGDDVLFSERAESAGINQGFFPKDYISFTDGSALGKENAVSSGFRGLQYEAALRLNF